VSFRLDERLAASHHKNTTEAVVIVAIHGMIVVAIRRTQIHAIIVVPRSTAQNAALACRTAPSAGGPPVVRTAFPAKFESQFHQKNFRPLRGPEVKKKRVKA
jgi:hypothetical protein